MAGWAPVAHAEVRLPEPSVNLPVVVRADTASRWTEGAYEVRQLHGEVTIEQAGVKLRGSSAVVWVERQPMQAGPLYDPTRLLVYLEGADDRPVVLTSEVEGQSPTRWHSPTWAGRLATVAGVDWRTPEPIEHEGARPEVAERGASRLSLVAQPNAPPAQPNIKPPTKPDPEVKPAQFSGPIMTTPSVAAPQPQVLNPGGVRRVRILPRSDVGLQADFKQLPSGESVAILSGGANVLVDGLQVEGLPGDFGAVDSLDLETDRAVIWTAGADALIGADFEQANEVPLEIYLEGNIVFRSGDRTIFAERMYYDVRRRTGVVLNAELLTPLPENDEIEYGGLVRLKAGVLRQLDGSRFVAQDGLVTTSRLEEPAYSFRSDTITFQDLRQPVIDPLTGRPAIDPTTGLPRYTRRQLARSRGNTVEVGGVPVFYWPTIATDLEEPRYYVDNLRIRNDNIFGTQLLLDLDMFQLLGIDPPQGVDWTVGLDYLSDRGLGHGTRMAYNVDSFFSLQGPAEGALEFFGIHDSGRDNLGVSRRGIDPESDYRGRAFWNHRQNVAAGLLEGWIVQAEVGWISDRTFLEQYYEPEWDQNKDQATGVRLKRLRDTRSLSIEANARINNFFTETEWLPRLDHYVLGQDLAGGLTWFGATSLGYANIGVATTPTDATLAGQFNLLPWEQDAMGNPISGSGERLVTRHEIDLPINLAPFKVVPYALGEVGTWGADLQGNDIQRAYGQVGVRASLPMWRVNPNVRDPLFNLNGLAHKVVFDAEVSYADANENFDQFPLYDELEDNAFEDLRRRLFEPGFGGLLAGGFYDDSGAVNAINARFDPRFYAIRSGVQGLVATPSFELVEDQAVARVGMHHRLQTKRGAPGQQRIVDWLVFNASAAYFPRANRDNIGADVGMINYDALWNLGDRFSVVADGYLDTFGSGLRTYSGGVRLGRPSRINSYIGYRTISGPFAADLLTTSIYYRPTPKWVLGATAVVDFSPAGNIGQSVLVSRIGESLVSSLRVNVDESKNNVGVSFLVEPRFLPRTGVARRSGLEIPPAGAEYLE